MRKTTSGFTIVELLIVIIVIAILAAISIVAYNGIQQRAQNIQTINAVKVYQKALIQYAIDNHAYPGAQWCFGEQGCAGISSNSSVANNAIRPYFNNASSLPQPSQVAVQYGGSNTRTGAAYSYSNTYMLDGVVYPWGINYVLQGVGCSMDGVLGTNPNWPNFTRTPNSSGATETQTGNSFCRILLPDPTTL